MMNSTPGLPNFVPNHLTFTTEPLNVDVNMESINEICNFDDQAARKPFMKRRGPSDVKVPADVKRRRRNYQAKKLLVPKNPLMILNELKPGISYSVSEHVSEVNHTVFNATVEVDGVTFSGQGLSKKQAQTEAAEAALRGIYFNKLLDQLVKKDEDIQMVDPNQAEASQGSDQPKSSFPEDDTPWAGLASLAMYKLVNEWQIPDSKSVPSSNQSQVPSSSQLKAKLPSNASDVDPVMLLNQINPCSKFVEMSRDVRNGATVFTISVDFNGASYVGSATKKKTAKKLCAKSALMSLGVEYKD